MIYDAWLQEQKLEHDVPLPPAHAVKVSLSPLARSLGAPKSG